MRESSAAGVRLRAAQEFGEAAKTTDCGPEAPSSRGVGRPRDSGIVPTLVSSRPHQAQMLPVLLLCLVQGETILDPKAWRSRSGEYELRMDPSQREGLGPAIYQLLRSNT